MKRMDYLLTMHREDPTDPFIRYALAKEHESEGNVDEALRLFDELMCMHPDYVGLYWHYGKLLADRNQRERALMVYESGIAVAKKLSDFHALAELQSAKLNLELE